MKKQYIEEQIIRLLKAHEGGGDQGGWHGDDLHW